MRSESSWSPKSWIFKSFLKEPEGRPCPGRAQDEDNSLWTTGGFARGQHSEQGNGEIAKFRGRRLEMNVGCCREPVVVLDHLMSNCYVV